jgi:hypothetical protein
MEGAGKTQEDTSVTYDEAKTLIRAHIKKQNGRACNTQEVFQLKDGYYHLSRKN